MCTDNQVNKLKWLLIQEGNQNNVHVTQQQETKKTIKLKRKDAYWSLPIVTNVDNGNTHTIVTTQNTQMNDYKVGDIVEYRRSKNGLFHRTYKARIIEIEKHTCKIEVLETGETFWSEYGNIIHLYFNPLIHTHTYSSLVAIHTSQVCK